MTNAVNLANAAPGLNGSGTNVTVAGNLTVVSTVTAASFVGNGSGLTGLAGGFSNLQVFTSSGSWTVPAGITKAKVTVIGGGGGGGGGARNSSSGSISVGGRASCGGGAIEVIAGLTPGASIAVTIGAAGTGGNGVNGQGVTAQSGTSGGTSSFGAFCSATGGSPGVGASADNTSETAPGASAANGGIGSGGDLNLPGSGEMSALGLGATNNLFAAGNTGRGFGGGGGGGLNHTTPGGAGSAGVVIVEW